MDIKKFRMDHKNEASFRALKDSLAHVLAQNKVLEEKYNQTKEDLDRLEEDYDELETEKYDLEADRDECLDNWKNSEDLNSQLLEHISELENEAYVLQDEIEDLKDELEDLKE